jgi:hypothetical protein
MARVWNAWYERNFITAQRINRNIVFTLSTETFTETRMSLSQCILFYK